MYVPGVVLLSVLTVTVPLAAIEMVAPAPLPGSSVGLTEAATRLLLASAMAADGVTVVVALGSC